ncbi:hypothetical protein FRC05_003609 [Tulasnella sp. 425]|nr:hypothetical protein FRC05_003609 [Tulasnella sp. 425]
MDISLSVPTTVKSVAFTGLSAQDIRRISVKQITNPQLLDDLNRPTEGGLYDPALGPLNKHDLCGTCRMNSFTCPGHFGHIELPSPLFHPLYFADMFRLLGCVCMFCHQFKAGKLAVSKCIAQLRLLDHGLIDAAEAVEDVVSSAPGKKLKLDLVDDEDEEGEIAGTGDPNAVAKALDKYVKHQLRRASGSRRDDYHDSVVYNTRKAVIKAFLYLKNTRCKYCSAKAYMFRKETYTKLIEYDLPQKGKDTNTILGAKRPNVLASSTTQHDESQRDEDGDDEMNSESEEGEDIQNSDGSDSDDDESKTRKSKKDGKIQGGPAIDYQGRVKGPRGRSERLIVPEEARAHIRRLFENEHILCGLIFGPHGSLAPIDGLGVSPASADMFFVEVVAIPPCRFRPPAERMGQLMEHPQNTQLGKVLNSTYTVRDLNKQLRELSDKNSKLERIPLPKERDTLIQKLINQLVQLQVEYNVFVDSSKAPSQNLKGSVLAPGVKNILEKKAGLFRKNMMGKRVNYAARSVISPDVNIESNEIGIPPVFARKLTFPEPVTQHNVHLMRQLVINGPKNYPGANMVQYEDGSIQSLERMTQEQRIALANQLLTPQEGKKAVFAQAHTLSTRTIAVPKKVYRHLQSGDQLILNRQPTLHKPSMMVHKARVLKGEKTIRMHYANCNSYNADFDGDEMNIHFPQTQVSRAEARFIASTDNQYLVPTSGNPLRGLIQDHVVAGVWMTYKETFFTREEYQQLLYGALKPEDNYTGGGRIHTVPPAIWKPKPLWTGKQIISTIMKNITPETAAGMHLFSQSKILNSHWGRYAYTKDVKFKDGSKMTMKLDGDQSVIFYDGDLVCGVLDKSQYGATAYGMVHSVYELYGAETAGRLLSILSRLFTKFLQHRAFTCRMDDLLLTPEGDKVRRQQIGEASDYGFRAAVENFPALREMDTKGPALGKQLNILLEEVLRDDKKMNDLDVTVKKKMAGLTQAIASAAIPSGLHRRFPDNHMQTMVMSGAKGSAVNARQISCGLGQTELEGRRVPHMVSGKTLPSFKPFETAAIAGGYIASRFLTGIKAQEFFFHCMAGREGLIDTAVKTSRSGYLQRCLIKHLEGLRVHYDNTVRGSDSSVFQFLYGGDGLDVTKQMHLHQFDFAAANIKSLIDQAKPAVILGAVDDETAVKHMKKVLKHADEPNRYPPTVSIYSPTRYLGSTSERFAKALEGYVKKNVGKTLEDKKAASDNTKRTDLLTGRKFKDLMNIRYMRALAEPGEAIGLLAAQGIGEPSTQMTLNTFHFAGHGAANVTLGIPRLREIVMTAARKPVTPTMTLPITPGLPKSRVESFCKKANRLSLSEVVDEVIVTERLEVAGADLKKTFHVKLKFFPQEQYEKEYLVRPAEILEVMGASFPAVLIKELGIELKKLGESFKAQKTEIGEGKQIRENVGRAGGDSDDEGGRDDDGAEEDGVELADVDVDDEKAMRNRKEMDFEDEDDDLTDDQDDVAGGNDTDDFEAAFDSDNLDGLSPRREKKPSKKEKWNNKLLVAQDLFRKQGGGRAYDLQFPRDGKECSFKVEFDIHSPKLLLVGIIERACTKTVIRHISGVSRCREFIPDNKSQGPKFMTEGVNLKGMWKYCHDEADLDALESNDVYAMLQTYGVESARETIIREMANVFGVYSIKVDPRHLMLIADYMTFDGGYKAFSRTGIKTNSSVLLRASYESTGTMLAEATLYGEFDQLTSPASSIVLGQPPRNGTGLFGVYAPVPVSA